MCCTVNYGLFLCCDIFGLFYVFCLLVVRVRLSVPMQMIDWKERSPK